MRQAIYDYLYANKGGLKGGITLSDKLPWVDGQNVPLYLGNMKSVYVDLDQVIQESLMDAINGAGFITETTTVKVYLAIDAKQLIVGYEDSVNLIKTARLTQDISGVISRLCQVKADYIGDNVVTTFEFSFRKMISNQ